MGRLVTSRGTFGSYVQIDAAALAAYIASPHGPVARRLIDDGEIVKQGARRQVGVARIPPAGPRRTRRPGTLRDSIVKRFGVDSRGFVVLVGSDDPIAVIHHEGTTAHPIVARRKPRLVFYSWRARRVIVTKRVRHPGTRPNHYLTDQLPKLRGRY